MGGFKRIIKTMYRMLSPLSVKKINIEYLFNFAFCSYRYHQLYSVICFFVLRVFYCLNDGGLCVDIVEG